MKLRILLLILLLSGAAQAITPWEKYSITRALGQSAWETSEQLFRKLQETELPPEQAAQVEYNLGLSLYHQEKFEEALPYFETAASTEDEALKAKAFYNQGNSLYNLERLPEARSAFEKALLLNPEDDDARYNIELILDQQQQNQKNGESEDPEESEKEQDSQPENGSGENSEEQQQQENQDQQQQQQQSQNGKEQNQESSQEMTPEEKRQAQEEAEKARLLDYFKQQEREGRPATRVRAQSPPVSGKTW
ncbi:MAG: tetratricopeptide repeat protein [Vulcanimicrobiota bacterium]